MMKRLTRTGNSWALVLDRALLERLRIDVTTPLEVTADDDTIVLTPLRPRGRATRRTRGVAETRRRYAASVTAVRPGPPSVGLRELKSRLGEYVRRVRAGETILVTDRGHVVAELAPRGATGAPSEDGLLALARRGLVRLGSGNRPDLYPPMPRIGKPGLVKRLLDWERGER